MRLRYAERGIPSRMIPVIRKCSNCFVEEPEGRRFQVCARCRKAHYCGAECQRAHWPALRRERDSLRSKRWLQENGLEIVSIVALELNGRDPSRHAIYLTLEGSPLRLTAVSSAIDPVEGEVAEAIRRVRAKLTTGDILVVVKYYCLSDGYYFYAGAVRFRSRGRTGRVVGLQDQSPDVVVTSGISAFLTSE